MDDKFCPYAAKGGELNPAYFAITHPTFIIICVICAICGLIKPVQPIKPFFRIPHSLAQTEFAKLLVRLHHYGRF
jgi:hypothetical protein